MLVLRHVDIRLLLSTYLSINHLIPSFSFFERLTSLTDAGAATNLSIEFLIQLLVLNVCFEYKIVHKLFERLDKVRGFT
jgi:hypothetical protein